MKIMSINDNVALVFDYKAGDTTLIRCDCYFEVKYSGYISERQPMWLDSERSIIDMGDGLFVLNFGGTLLECYGSHRNVISEVIKTFYKDDPAKAIESFDSLFLKIFTITTLNKYRIIDPIHYLYTLLSKPIRLY